MIDVGDWVLGIRYWLRVAGCELRVTGLKFVVVERH